MAKKPAPEAPEAIAPPLLAQVYRGSQVECSHFGHVVVAGADGEIIASVGNPQAGTYLRSSAKPFQAMPLLDYGTADYFDLTAKELALVCASHNGERFHVAAARSILRKARLAPSLLQCGVHRPLGVDSGVVAERAPYTVFQNNCSGKHLGMLAACVHKKWPTENYLDPAHPHQQNILQTIAAFAAIDAQQIGIGIDGCSAPVFYLPLQNIACMYARLAAAESPPAKRIFETMWQHADMVAGTQRFDTAVMRALRGKVVAKIGAEGVECLAIRHPRPMGLVVKIVDGARRAVPPVVLRLLMALGVAGEAELAALRAYVVPEILNHRGLLVGRVRCALDLL